MKVSALLMLALAATPAAEDARLLGGWKDAERGTVSEFTVAADGSWSAVVVVSPRASEVGKRSFENIRWNGETKRFAGKLIKPEDGQVVDVELWLRSDEQMTAEARVFIFSKTLSFTRVKRLSKPDGGTPDAGG